MATIINADTSDGLKLTSDTSGEIQFQSGGTTKMTVGSSGVSGIPTYAGTKNLIINGNMQIAQRGTSATGVATSGYYTVDRWQTLFSGAGTFTVSQDTDVPSGQGFANSLKLDCTTANSSLDATDFIFVVQKMEGQNLQNLKYGTSSAESLTVSFWIKSNLTGNYVCNLYSSDNSQLISASYTVNTADTWEKKTITFSGDTTNVLDNDNNKSLELEFWFTGGSNFTSGTLNTSWTTFSNANRNVGGQTNLGSSTSNYINITGVQLEVGDTATDFENLQYGQQLALCQRYYQEYGGAYLIGGYQSGASEDYRRETFPVTMRATPTASSTGTWATTGTSNTKPNIAAGSNNGVTIYAVTTGGNWYMDANSVDDKLIFSAEL